MGIFTECAKCDELKAEIERLRDVIDRAAKAWLSLDPGVAFEGDVGGAMEAAVAEIKRLRIENSQWQSACAGYTEALAAQDKRVIELMEELARIHDQIAKHNISVREAIRRGEAFEWKTLTLDS